MGDSTQAEGGRARDRVGIATVIALGSLALAACAGPTPPVTDPTVPEAVEVIQDSSDSATNPEFSGLPTLDSLQISADLDAQGVAARFTEILGLWNRAGANQENFDLQYEGDDVYLSQPEYLQLIVDATEPVFAEALYGDNWQDPKFSEAIARSSAVQYPTLGAYFTTQGPDFKAPYERRLSLVDVSEVVEDATTLSMEVVVEDSDNGPEIGTDYTISGIQSRAVLHFVVENGHWVLSSPPDFQRAN